MIIFFESQNGDRKHWQIDSFDDFQPMFSLFPNIKNIVMSSEKLEDAINSTVEYLSSGMNEAWTEQDEEVSKALKDAGVALGIALGAMAPSNIGHESKPPIHLTETKQASNPESVPYGQHPADAFLWNLEQIESAGGKLTDHPVVKYGLSRGDRAMGRWGMLRNTVLEMNNRARLAGKLSPGHKELGAMSRDQMAHHLKQNPQVELDLARQTAMHVLNRHKGNTAKAAYSWLHGHNLHSRDITSNQIRNSDYVNKYKTFNRKNPFKDPMRNLTNIAKFEVDGDFEGRLKSWYEVRMEQARQPLPRDRTYVPDPGRIREEELDEKPADKSNLVEYFKQLISNAKKAIKS